jgi:hypothetical protein
VKFGSAKNPLASLPLVAQSENQPQMRLKLPFRKQNSDFGILGNVLAPFLRKQSTGMVLPA